MKESAQIRWSVFRKKIKQELSDIRGIEKLSLQQFSLASICRGPLFVSIGYILTYKQLIAKYYPLIYKKKGGDIHHHPSVFTINN